MSLEIFNTFEFLDVNEWCRLAVDKNEFFSNQKTFLPLFFNSNVNLKSPVSFLDTTLVDKKFYNLPSNGGFSLKELCNRDQHISGSSVANLGEVIIKDSTLLILIKDNLALTEGYGDNRWLKYQINSWPSAHNQYPCLVAENSQQQPLETRIKGYRVKKNIQNIPIPGIYLSVRSIDKNIYHWIFETLPRLKCLEVVPELKEIPLIIREPLNQFQKDTLKLLGVSNKCIVTNGESFKASQLFFPSIPSPPTLHAECIFWLRNKILGNMPALSSKKRRLYISRKDSSRQVSNEEDLLFELNAYGFECLCMSNLSAVEQINAFREAEIVILPHGAAGSNILFASQGCEIIELHSPDWINNVYFCLSSILGLNYRYLMGTQISNSSNYSINISDIKILLAPFAP